MNNLGNKFLYEDDFAVDYTSSYDHAMDFHLHDDFEVYHSICGGQFYLIGDMVYEVEPGDLFIINSNEVHKSVAMKNMPYKRYLLTFKPSAVLNYCTEQTDLFRCFTTRAKGFSHKIHLTTEQEDDLLRRYQLIDSCTGYGADVMKLTHLIQLLIYINDLFIKNKVVDPKENNFKLKPILDYINTNLTEELSLDLLENEFHINKYYICDLFKRYTGTTVNKYIVTRRLSEAKKLLLQGHSVSEVCQLSGFNDYCHFIRTFTKVVGVSPKKYGASNI